MLVETKLSMDQQDVRSFSAENGEPDWFTAFRVHALDLAGLAPMPEADKTKLNKWNFTQFTGFRTESAAYRSLNELPEKVKALVNLENAEQNLYIQHNQQPAYLSLSDDVKAKGVILTDILTAVKEYPDLVKKYFMKDAVKVDEHKLTALNAALVNGGVFLYVPKNAVIEAPIQTIFIHDHETAPLFNHVLVVADDNSAVTYVENYISVNDEAKGIVNIIAEVIAGSNAKIEFGAVDTLAKDVTTYVNRRGITGRDAQIEWALGMMNDGNTISDNTTNLIGDGSVSHTKTVAVSRGKQTQNFTTRITHFGKNTESFILKHGVVKDAATAIFNGIGKIEHGASKSDAEQESRVLMLSEKARGDANPMLLIDEDDVMAGHAASVGRVDPVQLYYLMSRGISKNEAERLIIHGFLAPVVAQLPIDSVKKQLTEVIERKVR
ncbi:Fe-S cluster assembly protein SufD [Heyndrickxia acidiproducens]|uniref:Fe-S cluster assembly protein SufD n=1 Tax=Heyndrickxia acidiproducens TaxID=1121084 RepID=UPI00037946E5|nr:Fe-S cluster assembly protein SufD [Heyndrickxia acidiproducens]